MALFFFLSIQLETMLFTWGRCWIKDEAAIDHCPVHLFYKLLSPQSSCTCSLYAKLDSFSIQVQGRHDSSIGWVWLLADLAVKYQNQRSKPKFWDFMHFNATSVTISRFFSISATSVTRVTLSLIQHRCSSNSSHKPCKSACTYNILTSLLYWLWILAGGGQKNLRWMIVRFYCPPGL